MKPQISVRGPASRSSLPPSPAEPAVNPEPIVLPSFDHEAAYTKPQLVELYGEWSAVMQRLDAGYQPKWAGKGAERVSFADLDDAVRDLVMRASEIYADRYGASYPDESEDI